MTPSPFLRSALIGFAISSTTATVYLSLLVALDQYSALAISGSLAAFMYLLHLLSMSKSSPGRIIALAVFTISSILLLLSAPPISIVGLVNVVFIWLIRACYLHKHVLLAIADLILSGFAFLIAMAAAMQSHSVFISIWCFFLVQSMIVPSLSFCLEKLNSSMQDKPAHNASHRDTSSRFQNAHNDAENALTRLAQQQH